MKKIIEIVIRKIKQSLGISQVLTQAGHTRLIEKFDVVKKIPVSLWIKR